MEPVSLLSQRLAAAFLAASFGALVSLIALRKGYYHLPPDETMGKKIPSGRHVLEAFGIFLFIQLFLLPLVYFLWEKGIGADLETIKFPDDVKGWVSLGLIALTGIGLIGLFASLNKPTRDAIWGSRSSSRGVKKNIIDFLAGSLTWVIAYPWIIVTGQLLGVLLALVYSGPLPDQAAVKHLKDLLGHPVLFGATALAVFTIIPFIEEFLFRGFLQSWMKTFLGRTRAILLTSLIFASFHFSFSQGIENIEFISSLFLLSCYLGFIKERQQSLWGSIGLHSTFNFISILMLFEL